MTLRDRLQALFSPTRRWIGADGQAIQAGGWFGPIEVVVPRAASQYRRFAFPQIGAAQRSAALRLAAERASPASGSRWMARWQGDVAHVWLVDPVTLEALDPAATLLAESSLHAPPSTADAQRLLALRDGVEGQVWRDGVLLAARWWAAAPDAESWSRFLRAAAQSPDQGPPPAVENAALAAAPWGRADGRLRWSATQLERTFWRALGVLVAVLLGWQLVATLTWSIAAAWQDAELERVRAESMPLIEAREQAEAARERMAAYIALTRTPVDHALIADLHRALPADARLISWYRDAGRLRVELESASSDPRIFVQAFREHPLLANMIANPGESGRMQLEVDLDAATLAPRGSP